LFAWTPITPGLASPTSGGCGACIGRDGGGRILRSSHAIAHRERAVRGAPDGMPSIVYVFGLSFLFWWIAIDLVWRIWRWVANPR
jgi:hypothetical protein